MKKRRKTKREREALNLQSKMSRFGPQYHKWERCRCADCRAQLIDRYRLAASDLERQQIDFECRASGFC